jgi:hypothetical protein
MQSVIVARIMHAASAWSEYTPLQLHDRDAELTEFFSLWN